MSQKRNPRESISALSSYMSLLTSSSVPIARTYFSTSHLWASKHFIELAIAIEEACEESSSSYLKHRAYVTNSIFSSIAFLEASINEFIKNRVDEENRVEGVDKDLRSKIKGMWDTGKN